MIDGIGVQGHGLESTSLATIRNNLDALAETGLPIYVSEYEVDSSDDNQQRTIYQEQFPVFWEHPSVKGVTLWGYIQGEIWKANAYLVTSGGSERPALQWLRSYLQGGGATPGPTPAPTQVPSALFVESGGQVVMEAEHYTDYFPGTGDFSHYAWVEDTSMSDASGGIHMFASPNEGGYALEETESPRMGYFVDFSTSESYYVWIRRAAGGGGDDSCQISIDAGGVIQWSYGGSSSFEWIKYDSTFSISSGAHIFKVGMREDGARVDKIILTTNSGYTPSVQGPAESQMTGSPSTQPPTNPPAVTNPPTNPPTVTPGDTNSDGGVTIVDALLTAQYYVGLNPSNFNPSAADVNCSGSIDIVDALLIAQYYVGLINEFPC